MSTYVVSPSASGIGSQERFLSVIEQEHIAIIGYAPDDGKADSFYAIKDGDLVIIARGANRNKECFFAGLADGAKAGNHAIRIVPAPKSGGLMPTMR